MEDCLQRLHLAILDHESGKSSVWRLEHAFRWFDEQMIKIYADSSDQDGESPEITWGESSSFEAIRLMISFVLIQADRPALVGRVGSSSGKLLAMITSSQSRSLIDHILALGEATATLVLTLMTRPDIDLSSCSYEFCQSMPTRYPLVLKVDDQPKIKSLVTFWVYSIETYLGGADFTENLDQVMHVLSVFVNNAAALQLPLVAEHSIIRCLGILLDRCPSSLSGCVASTDGIFLWCCDSLQDLQDSPGVEQNVHVDFIDFLDSLVHLLHNMIVISPHMAKVIAPHVIKVLKRFVVKYKGTHSGESSSWSIISTHLCSSMLIVLKRCIFEFPILFPSIRFMLDCINDLKSHHFISECIFAKFSSHPPSKALCDRIGILFNQKYPNTTMNQQKRGKKPRSSGSRQSFRSLILPDDSDSDDNTENDPRSILSEDADDSGDISLHEMRTRYDVDFKVIVDIILQEDSDHKSVLFQ